MKRTLFIFLILFVVMQFIRPSSENIAVDKNLEIKAPDEVMNILKVACYDCHSNEVKYPLYFNIAPFSWVISSHIEDGRKALNFSTWEEYSAEKKAEKIKEIYRTVYAPMPLQSYMWLHKEANLTKEQRSTVRDWTGVRAK